MTYKILTGHAIDLLNSLEAESAQTCVTSPPYWGLRDYGDSGQDWPEVTFCPVAGLPPLTIPAQRAALGLEADPWAYVGHMVEVFRAVRRVLRADGTLWLNLGDSYASNPASGGRSQSAAFHGSPGLDSDHSTPCRQYNRPAGLKRKDLCGIPWRVAYALQADGWYLRSEIIWHKPNPMPESVTDRPTKGHEQVFLLSKGPKYFYDVDAIREDIKPTSGIINGAPLMGEHRLTEGGRRTERREYDQIKGSNARTVWTMPTKPYPGAHFAVFPPDLPARCIKAGSRLGDLVIDPFSGAGTTGLIAQRLRRDYIGTEQNETYAEQSRRRIEADAPLFNRNCD